MTIEIGGRGAGAWTRGGPAQEPIWDRPRRPAWMRIVNGVGGALGRLGVRPRLEPRLLLAQAERRAGLSDWGDDRFREGLAALVDAFEAQDSAHTFGRLFFREYCVRALVNRLKIQGDLTRHPEILEVPVRRPLIVTGLPRSGTTFLHRLLCEDPSGRPLLFWETLEPSPAPGPETHPADGRVGRAKKAVRTLESLAPRIRAAHLFDAESPEECNNLFAHGFIAGINGFLFDVPGYVEWMEGQDLVGPYRYLRQQLQLLSWRRPEARWVLKAPAHLYGLDALLTVFPDACIVQIHRSPLEVLPSLCSLSSALRSILSDRVDLKLLGAEYTEAMARGTERAIDSRAAADPARFTDVVYKSLLADPIGTVRAIRGHFGDPCDETFEDRMRTHLAENPQHKHGVHRYSLEQFGLDPGAVNERFAKYRAWVAEHLGTAL